MERAGVSRSLRTRRNRARLLALGTVALIASGVSATITPAARASAPARGLEGIPRFSHVVVLVEENETESTTFDPASPAHYLNSLRPQGVFLPNYYGTDHASLDNYVAMVSGQPDNPASAEDCLELSLYNCAQIQSAYDNGRNLGDQLDAAQVTWTSYMDSTPTACFHAAYSPTSPAPDPYRGDTQKPPARDYADRHNPFVWFPDFVGDPARCAAHQKPYSTLAGDLAANRLPQFSFITPDTCNDGHDNPCSDGKPGGLVSADAWLKTNVPPLLDYLRHHDGLLIVNFDEGLVDLKDTCSSCASGGIGGRTGALLISPRLQGGLDVSTSYDHFSLLRTIEDSFGISEHLNLAAAATPMTQVFAAASR
ncbi:MAG TPA: alkaline phosphatase family protein [Acidimicrobiales bacterium]|nr:alkaline phosphatase family protein [Acidimicrobiales bacterium]